MSMGIGTNTQNPDEGDLRRIQQNIACGVWFTSTGAALPKLIKYKDSEGMIRQISRIRLLSEEKKFYCGIPAVEYKCITVYDDREYPFRLYYYIETGCWTLSWGA